jgi:hypothetical protein
MDHDVVDFDILDLIIIVVCVENRTSDAAHVDVEIENLLQKGMQRS